MTALLPMETTSQRRPSIPPDCGRRVESETRLRFQPDENSWNERSTSCLQRVRILRLPEWPAQPTVIASGVHSTSLPSKTFCVYKSTLCLKAQENLDRVGFEPRFRSQIPTLST